MTISNSKFSLNSFEKKVIIKSSIFLKAAFLIYFLISNTASSTAQDKKGYIGISLGPSLPIGDFASKDISNRNAGFASIGGIFDISFAYKIGTSNFGIAALLRAQANPFDEEALAESAANAFTGIGGANWDVVSDLWALGGIFVGGYGSFPVSDKVSFDTRALVGYSTAIIPNITLQYSDINGRYWAFQKTSTASAFAYMLGAGFKFNMGKSFCLLTNIDLMSAKPEFKDIQTLDSESNRSSITYSQRISTINVSIGIAVRI